MNPLLLLGAAAAALFVLSKRKAGDSVVGAPGQRTLGGAPPPPTSRLPSQTPNPVTPQGLQGGQMPPPDPFVQTGQAVLNIGSSVASIWDRLRNAPGPAQDPPDPSMSGYQVNGPSGMPVADQSLLPNPWGMDRLGVQTMY